jgi:23S rRNA (adenine2503-C2)-methyltransferase
VAASLLALSEEELERRVVAAGGRPFHARVIGEQVLGAGVLDYARMTALPRSLRGRLAAELPILASVERAAVRAADGTTRLLLWFPDADGGGASVETVHIPPRPRSRAERAGNGATLCVSTQVGCPVACPFCASGRAGLRRNLTAGEITEQFVRGRALGPLSRAVVMGIGEPFLNLPALLAALERVRAPFGLGTRKVTVSTVGFPERLRSLAPTRPPFQLAISLHTPFDAQRDELVPAMRGTPIEEVLTAGDDWFERTGREVTYEMVLLAGVTDTADHASTLARRLGGRRCSVNLIPFNAVEDSGFRRPAPAAVEAFRGRLTDAGLVATVRHSRGAESDAACGQLRLRSEA